MVLVSDPGLVTLGKLLKPSSSESQSLQVGIMALFLGLGDIKCSI